MPINFQDEDGVRWTVVARRAPRPDDGNNEVLLFTSASGERRTCDACLPEGTTWEDVEERVWCALLRYSDVVPERPGEPVEAAHEHPSGT